MSLRDKVTIGVTCFNAQDTIERAIRSALIQRWDNLEIIVVDDCSSDGSQEIISRLASENPQIRTVFLEKNGGFASAINRILEEATGEFITFFDDDDDSLPPRVQAQVKRIIAYEKEHDHPMVACYGSGERRYPSGYVLDLIAVGSTGAAPHGADYANYLLYHQRPKKNWQFGFSASCSLMARRRVFETIGGFDPQLRWIPDTDFAIRLALQDGHFIGTTEKVFTQYSTDGPDKCQRTKLEGAERLVMKHEQYLRKKSRFYYALHWHRLRYWHNKRDYFRFSLEFLGILARNPVASLVHLLDTGPKRLRHERRMRKGASL